MCFKLTGGRDSYSEMFLRQEQDRAFTRTTCSTEYSGGKKQPLFSHV